MKDWINMSNLRSVKFEPSNAPSQGEFFWSLWWTPRIQSIALTQWGTKQVLHRQLEEWDAVYQDLSCAGWGETHLNSHLNNKMVIFGHFKYGFAPTKNLAGRIYSAWEDMDDS